MPKDKQFDSKIVIVVLGKGGVSEIEIPIGVNLPIADMTGDDSVLILGYYVKADAGLSKY